MTRYQLKMRGVYVDALDASCRRSGCRETHNDDLRRLFETREEAEYAATHPGFLGAHGPRFEVVEVDE